MIYKSESSFLQELEKKAEEQRRLTRSEILPNWAKGIGEWLVVNPWRVLIPIAGLSYCLLRVILGVKLREFTLGIFGGFS